MRTIKELQENRIEWTLDCLDRIYLNLYSPILNSPPGVVTIIRRFLECDIPHPKAFKSVRDEFVIKAELAAEERGLDIYRFSNKDQNSKEEIAQQHLKDFPDKEGVFFIGKAQEKVKAPKGTWYKSEVTAKGKWLKLGWGNVMANQYYFYFRDKDWGVGFIKFSSYAPFTGRFYINGHEYVKCQLTEQGILFEELDNGIGWCEDPQAAQKIANSITATKLEKLVRKWIKLAPNPLAEMPHRRGNITLKYHISMLQMEFARTQLWKKASDGLKFFEQVIRENIDLGRPEKVGVIFNKRILPSTMKVNRFMTRVFTTGVIPVFNIFFKSNKLKQYFKEGRALRSELTVNHAPDFGAGKTLNTENFNTLCEAGRQTINRLFRVETLCQDPLVSSDKIGAIESAAEVAGRRVSPLLRSNPRVRALFSAIIACHLIARGFRNRDLRVRVAHLLGKDPKEITTNQMTYDLRRLRGHGIVKKVEGTHRYEVTEEGLQLALFISRVEQRVYREGMADIFDDAVFDNRTRKALERFDKEVARLMQENLALSG